MAREDVRWCGERVGAAACGKPAGMCVVWRWLYIVAVFALTVLLLPLFLPVSCLITLYRRLLLFVLKKLLGDDVMIVSGQDAVWLQDCPTNKAIINSILIIKGQPELARYWDIMTERMVRRQHGSRLQFPKLSMYTTRVLRRYVWVKEEQFDIKEHVYFYDKLPPRSKAELHEVTGEIFSKGLPDKKAPWEMVLIPPMSGQDEFVLALRFHHCMGDGISLTKAFVHCCTDNPPQELKARISIGVGGKALKICRAILEGPSMVVSRLLKPKDLNPLHGSLLTGRKVVAWGRQISLAFIKKMNSVTGTTINDVLLSCLAGALADFLKLHHTQPATAANANNNNINNTTGNNIANNTNHTTNHITNHTTTNNSNATTSATNTTTATSVSSTSSDMSTGDGPAAASSVGRAPLTDICASVPVDVRSSKALTMDNQFALVFMDLPVDEDDPVRLLLKSKARMDAMKASPEPLVNHVVLSLLMAHLPSMLTKHAVDWLSEKCSIVLSNVPGPTALMKVNNQLIHDLIFWPPQRKNVGVGVSIMSYCDHLRIGVISDQAVLPQPSILTKLFLRRLERLARALHIHVH